MARLRAEVITMAGELADGPMSKSESKYLRLIIENGGQMTTRAIRREVSPHNTTGREGMSSLGAICKVLKRLERRGFLDGLTRAEYAVTGKGRTAAG